jgi:hypothetical protein
LRGIRTVAFVSSLALCAGCGGGAGSGNSATTPATSSPALTAHFSFAVPARATSAAVRRAAYISPASQSLEVDVEYGTATAVGAQLNLSPLPSDCTIVSGLTQCDISVVAQSSATNFVIEFFDQPNSQGNLLSTVTVPVPPAVNGVANVNATLLPVAAGVQLAVGIPLANGVPASTSVIFTALDADGNPISGSAPFSTPIQLVPQSPAIAFTPSTVTSPTTPVTVTYDGTAITTPNVVAQIGSKTVTAPFPIFTTTTTPVLSITPANINVSVGGPSVPITVTLTGAAGAVTLTDTCVGGAQISLSQTTAPAGTPTTVNVTGLVAPSSNVTHACTLTGTFGSLNTSVFVDVNSNSFNVNARARHVP